MPLPSFSPILSWKLTWEPEGTGSPKQEERAPPVLAASLDRGKEKQRQIPPRREEVGSVGFSSRGPSVPSPAQPHQPAWSGPEERALGAGLSPEQQLCRLRVPSKVGKLGVPNPGLRQATVTRSPWTIRRVSRPRPPRSPDYGAGPFPRPTRASPTYSQGDQGRRGSATGAGIGMVPGPIGPGPSVGTAPPSLPSSLCQPQPHGKTGQARTEALPLRLPPPGPVWGAGEVRLLDVRPGRGTLHKTPHRITPPAAALQKAT